MRSVSRIGLHVFFIKNGQYKSFVLLNVSMFRLSLRSLSAGMEAVKINPSRFERESVAVLESILEVLERSSPDSLNVLNEGVLKVEFDHGTFIINKHSVTQQLWYSSPIIGPGYFEALTSSGLRWYSLKLEADVYTQFKNDVEAFTQGTVQLDFTT